MNTIRQNEKAIERGLKWLSSAKDKIIERGMLELLPKATEYAISLHDHSHYGHRVTEDSHGWALVKDGRIVKMGVNDGRHGEGYAHKQLRDVAQSIATPGYVGIVLASMTAKRDDGRPIIFEIEYEMDILSMTADEIIDNFQTYFKPIS